MNLKFIIDEACIKSMIFTSWRGGPSSYQYSFTSADACPGFTKIPQGECWEKLPTMWAVQTYLLIRLSCLELQKCIYFSIKFYIGKCK